jgi:hypothetical protein
VSSVYLLCKIYINHGDMGSKDQRRKDKKGGWALRNTVLQMHCAPTVYTLSSLCNFISNDLVLGVW